MEIVVNIMFLHHSHDINVIFIYTDNSAFFSMMFLEYSVRTKLLNSVDKHKYNFAYNSILKHFVFDSEITRLVKSAESSQG